MIDCSPDILGKVKNIIAKHLSGHKVFAFGSRVNGSAKKHSNLDLVIMSTEPIDEKIMAMLREEFEESTIPIKVDIVDWSAISEDFQSAIKGHLTAL